MFGLSRFKKIKDVTVEFQFGAYYSIKSKDGYDIIRLLDFPGSTYHYQLIALGMSGEQTLENVKLIKPEILHIPMETANLLGKEVKRLGVEPLTIKDLYGYSVYLEEMGAEEDAIKEHFEQLIRFSNEPPQKVRLYQDGDGISSEYL